ncbi:GNAT family N-acetyltransferase [Deinococcus budaensis]|uniref:GNAT superfamily N-acetyltransferase n=1 Tax=Deinococcus budaensis TaxID=1665626 RepID=A0A7W8LRV1_9DEIO|nr:GNAT family N-acetyltransferase [Deinococcus budaensis]MBB5236030.1 GNAT superfamily N-acetyltransferase [Deinococcus budaensis]
MRVREAGAADYPALAQVLGAVWPEHATTADTLAHEDAELRSHPRKPRLWRVLAEDPAGRVLGAGSLMQWPGMFHPGRYHAEVLVPPAHEGRGVGRALAAALETQLRGRGAREVLGTSREDRPRGLAFLEQQGFAEAMRYFASALSLPDFDPAPWASAARLPAGYRRATLADLVAERGEDAAWQAYFGICAAVRADVPRTGQATPLDFAHFRAQADDPRFLPGGVLFALTAQGEVAALTEVYPDAADPLKMQTGLTGTRREHRRRGLGLALKLAALELARTRGAASVWTDNASTNAPMLALNGRLGFVRQPAWVEMRRGRVEEGPL